MKNQIKELNGLKGKTIVDVLKSCGDMYLKFNDGTFTMLSIKDITEGYGYSQSEIDVDSYDCDKTDSELLKFGIISKKEYELAREESENGYKKWCENIAKLNKERNEKIELDILENLKNKYNK